MSVASPLLYHSLAFSRVTVIFLSILFYFVKYIENAKMLMGRLLESVAFKRPEQRIIEEQQRIDALLKRLGREIEVMNKSDRQRLLLLEKQLVALSPYNVLNRGYAIVYNADHEIVSSVKQVKLAAEIEVRLRDGQITSVTKSVKED